MSPEVYRFRRAVDIGRAGLLRLYVAAFCAVALLAGTSSAADRSAGGVAATGHPLATAAALEILEQGGNAVDAAVAAAFAIGVVEPHGSGLGGGGGMLVYLRDREETIYLNYYQRAASDPGAVDYDRSTDSRTAEAVIVPGTVSGLCRALEEWGTLLLPKVIDPAIRYAEEGFPVDRTLAGLILDNAGDFAEMPGFAEIFLEDGFPLMEGQLLRQPALAGVLRRIATIGRDGFYRGEHAATLVRELTAQGGVMSLADLAGYESVLVEPVRGTYRGLEVVSAPPPHAGVTLLASLNMVELIELDPSVHFTESPRVLHLMAESFRRTYADRSQFVGDPAFTEVPVAGLVSKAYAQERFQQINPYRAEPRNYRDTPAGAPLKFAGDVAAPRRPTDRDRSRWGWSDEMDEDHDFDIPVQRDPFDRWRRGSEPRLPRGEEVADSTKTLAPAFDDEDEEGFDAGGFTTHLSVIDGDGNMVSLTQTLGNFFGAQVMIDGVIYNNGRNNFSDISPQNLIEPNKRPRSTISPTLVFRDGEPWLAIGSPGAGRIIAATLQVLVNIADYGMDVRTANAAPRFFCQKFEDHLFVESRIDEEVRESLSRMGHSVRTLGAMDLFFGGVSVAAFDPNGEGLLGSSDPRRGGDAATLRDRLGDADED